MRRETASTSQINTEISSNLAQNKSRKDFSTLVQPNELGNRCRWPGCAMKFHGERKKIQHYKRNVPKMQNIHQWTCDKHLKPQICAVINVYRAHRISQQKTLETHIFNIKRVCTRRRNTEEPITDRMAHLTFGTAFFEELLIFDTLRNK